VFAAEADGIHAVAGDDPSLAMGRFQLLLDTGSSDLPSADELESALQNVQVASDDLRCELSSQREALVAEGARCRAELAAARGRLVEVERRRAVQVAAADKRAESLSSEVADARHEADALLSALVGAKRRATEAPAAYAAEVRAAAEAAGYQLELEAQNQAIATARAELLEAQSAAPSPGRRLPAVGAAADACARAAHERQCEEQKARSLRSELDSARRQHDALQAGCDAREFHCELLEEEVRSLRERQSHASGEDGPIDCQNPSCSSSARDGHFATVASAGTTTTTVPGHCSEEPDVHHRYMPRLGSVNEFPGSADMGAGDGHQAQEPKPRHRYASETIGSPASARADHRQREVTPSPPPQRIRGTPDDPCRTGSPRLRKISQGAIGSGAMAVDLAASPEIGRWTPLDSSLLGTTLDLSTSSASSAVLLAASMPLAPPAATPAAVAPLSASGGSGSSCGRCGTCGAPAAPPVAPSSPEARSPASTNAPTEWQQTVDKELTDSALEGAGLANERMGLALDSLGGSRTPTPAVERSAAPTHENLGGARRDLEAALAAAEGEEDDQGSATCVEAAATGHRAPMVEWEGKDIDKVWREASEAVELQRLLKSSTARFEQEAAEASELRHECTEFSARVCLLKQENTDLLTEVVSTKNSEAKIAQRLRQECADRDSQAQRACADEAAEARRECAEQASELRRARHSEAAAARDFRSELATELELRSELAAEFGAATALAQRERADLAAKLKAEFQAELAAARAELAAERASSTESRSELAELAAVRAELAAERASSAESSSELAKEFSRLRSELTGEIEACTAFAAAASDARHVEALAAKQLEEAGAVAEAAAMEQVAHAEEKALHISEELTTRCDYLQREHREEVETATELRQALKAVSDSAGALRAELASERLAAVALRRAGREECRGAEGEAREAREAAREVRSLREQLEATSRSDAEQGRRCRILEDELAAATRMAATARNAMSASRTAACPVLQLPPPPCATRLPQAAEDAMGISAVTTSAATSSGADLLRSSSCSQRDSLASEGPAGATYAWASISRGRQHPRRHRDSSSSSASEASHGVRDDSEALAGRRRYGATGAATENHDGQMTSVIKAARRLRQHGSSSSSSSRSPVHKREPPADVGLLPRRRREGGAASSSDDGHPGAEPRLGEPVLRRDTAASVQEQALRGQVAELKRRLASRAEEAAVLRRPREGGSKKAHASTSLRGDSSEKSVSGPAVAPARQRRRELSAGSMIGKGRPEKAARPEKPRPSSTGRVGAVASALDKSAARRAWARLDVRPTHRVAPPRSPPSSPESSLERLVTEGNPLLLRQRHLR